MKNYLATLALISVVLITGCKKDDFEEIVGLCPEVVTTAPLNGATGVPLNQTIQVTFNQPMNASTFTATSFSLNGQSTVLGSISHSGNTVTLTPTRNLEPFTMYTGRVRQTVMDLNGNALPTDYTWTFTTGAPGVNMFSLGRFGVIAATAITSTGLSVVNNLDVGISPGPRAAISGFPPATVVNGGLYASNDAFPAGTSAMLVQAKQELSQSYVAARDLNLPSANILTGDLGGRTLTPGVYRTASTLLIQSGNLTLNAQGDPNAYWVFQVGSDLTTIGGNGGNIILANGASADNVFWQVGSSATLGSNTNFKGNILALTSITLNPNATIDGRLLAQNGAVVLSNTNTINKP